MKKQIVFISSISWDFAWHRQQEIMFELSEKGFEILFVEPCTKNLFKSAFTKKKERIWVLTPSGLPYERVLRPINKINSLISKKQISKTMKKIGFNNPIVWLDRVHGFDFKYFSKNSYVVYDLIDEILAFGRVRNKKMLISLENRVLKRADLLISSSQTLGDRKIKQCGVIDKKFEFIPNGVDINRFKIDKEWDKTKQISRPRIGFVGTIEKRRMDCVLLNTIIKRNPNWNFIFIGPHDEFVNKEITGDNVFFFERVLGDKIPEVIASFDVGIIPYLVDKQDMDYVFPRKACEFLASGKPVISTPLKELVVFGEHVIVANNIDEFEKGIRTALLKEGGEEERKEFSKKFDWNVLLQSLIEKLQRGGRN